MISTAWRSPSCKEEALRTASPTPRSTCSRRRADLRARSVFHGFSSSRVDVMFTSDYLLPRDGRSEAEPSRGPAARVARSHGGRAPRVPDRVALGSKGHASRLPPVPEKAARRCPRRQGRNVLGRLTAGGNGDLQSPRIIAPLERLTERGTLDLSLRLAQETGSDARDGLPLEVLDPAHHRPGPIERTVPEMRAQGRGELDEQQEARSHHKFLPALEADAASADVEGPGGLLEGGPTRSLSHHLHPQLQRDPFLSVLQSAHCWASSKQPRGS